MSDQNPDIREEIQVGHLTDEVDEVVITPDGDELRACPFESEGEIGGDDLISYVELDVDLSDPRFEDVRAYVDRESSVDDEINYQARPIHHDSWGV